MKRTLEADAWMALTAAQTKSTRVREFDWRARSAAVGGRGASASAGCEKKLNPNARRRTHNRHRAADAKRLPPAAEIDFSISQAPT